jgi:SAM-dependent methyltransferase
MPVDATGKMSFDHIYTQPDPRDYFNTLRQFDYNIPQLAKPHFARIIREYRDRRQVNVPTVLDVGCSYGVNAALLKCDASMDELFERYRDLEADRMTLLAADRALARDRCAPVRFLGLDASQEALRYALEAGFLDGAIHADLEECEPTEEQRAQLDGVDLVISTGCIGYITEKTISRIVGEHRPWMAHFVLRMFPFDPVAETLSEAGYETVRHEGLFKQRRFATPQEQRRVLDTLLSVGADPRGLETDGWFYAQLYISKPRDGK